MASEKQCNDCGTPATVFLTFVTEGKVKSVALCKAHAEQTGVIDTPAFGLLGDDAPDVIIAEGGLGLRCHSCGLTQRDFERTGRIGCMTCYETYGSLLRPVLRKVQFGGEHLGKIPRGVLARNEAAISNRIRHLKTRIDDAVAREDYEDAAVFRDQINGLIELAEKAKG